MTPSPIHPPNDPARVFVAGDEPLPDNLAVGKGEPPDVALFEATLDKHAGGTSAEVRGWSRRLPNTPARAWRVCRRILGTAAAFFYVEGLHIVGIDRIIAEAGVAKATFYHHFPPKDELVRVYLDEEFRRQRTAAETIQAAAPEPREALLAIFDNLGENGASPRFRG